MKYFYADEKGIKEIQEIIVKRCILEGIVKDTNEHIKIIMDEKEFNDWRTKLRKK